MVWAKVVAVIVLAALAIAGCQTQPPRAGQAQPTLSLPELVQKINANNQRLRTLWTRITLEVDMRDPDTGRRDSFYADGGNLHYRAPGELRLWAKKDIAGLVLELGINAEKYWLIAPKPDTMWWGYVRNEPREAEIPLRPQDMLEILAIRPVDLSGPDAPVLRYSQKDEAYTLVWYRRTSGRYLVSREILYDQETLLPKTVLLFAPDGSLAVRATLSDYGDVDTPTKPKPQMARKYKLLLPGSRSQAILRVLNMTVSHEGAPDDRSFKMPAIRTVSKEKQIDAPRSK